MFSDDNTLNAEMNKVREEKMLRNRVSERFFHFISLFYYTSGREKKTLI